MIHDCWSAFIELIVTPFHYPALIWGIVPLYFGLILNELNSDKSTFRTAFQTGFSFLWAGAQWIWPYFTPRGFGTPEIKWNAMMPVNWLVTFLVLALGAIALVSGIRKKFPKHMRFVGHTRFANYFMIMIFPIQSHYLDPGWTWERLVTIVVFAVPVWLLLHFGLMPVRK